MSAFGQERSFVGCDANGYNRPGTDVQYFDYMSSLAGWRAGTFRDFVSKGGQTTQRRPNLSPRNRFVRRFPILLGGPLPGHNSNVVL